MKSGGWWGRQIAQARVKAALSSLSRPEAAPEPVRVACTPPLTPTQLAIAQLLADNLSHNEVAARLGCEYTTVKFHIAQAAQRIPGTLNPTARLIMWYRGASRELLEGTSK